MAEAKTSAWAIVVGAGVLVAMAVAGTSHSYCQATATNPMASFAEDDPSVAAARHYFNLFPSEEDRQHRLDNARTIIDVGLERGETEQVITIATYVSMQEVNLKNGVNFVDHKSCGIFQQQESAEYGTCSQISDPVYAANKFYDKLDSVITPADLATKSMMQIGIKVQIPVPEAYARRWNRENLGAVAEQTVRMFLGGSEQFGSCFEGVNGQGWRNPLDPGYNVGDGFEYREWSELKWHYGFDMGAGEGTPIYAAGPGTVVHAMRNGAFGNQVRIDHGGGYVTGYAHMIRFAPGIKAGDTVAGGQVIGYVGNTGRSYGNHLHFDVLKDGKFIDPIPFMESMGVKLR